MDRWNFLAPRGLLTVCTLFLASGLVRADPEIPDSIRAYLTQKYPGWQLAPINRDAEHVFKQGGWHGDPNFFFGDFDADRKNDYAIAIRYPGKDGLTEKDIALLRRGDTFESFDLDERTADPAVRSLQFMRPILRTEKLTDDHGKPVPHAQDGIELVTYNREAYAFFFSHRRFRKVRTVELK